MVATAIELQPREIILAGYDLFSHPRGRYPGEFQAINRYAHGHSRESEVHAIKELLETYSGKITIMSPILAQALREAGFDRFTEE